MWLMITTYSLLTTELKGKGSITDCLLSYSFQEQ
jgi:hypothetical protein